MSTLLVNLAGIALIVFVVRWFWLSRPKARRIDQDVVDIVVDGGTYSPPRIEVETGKEVSLRFIRKDPSPCAEKVVFDDLGISADLSLGKPTVVVITPTEDGEIPFTCQMQMYRGSLVAKKKSPLD